jgi:hypothetical protein
LSLYQREVDMSGIDKIRQDAQKVVRLSTLAIDELKELELDTITYTVRDKNDADKGSYEGRDLQEQAHLAAAALDASDPDNKPHWVEQKSNLDFAVEKEGIFDFLFDIAAKFNIVTPNEDMDAAIEALNNAVDCESIKRMIEDELKAVADEIKSMLEDSGILGSKADLLNIPSNPFKLPGWAKKFVTKYLGPQLIATVTMAIQIAFFIQKMIELLEAVKEAQERMEACGISVVNEVLDTAADTVAGFVRDQTGELDKILLDIDEIQNKVSDITGKPKSFNVSGGISGLTDSIANGAKADFARGIQEYLDGPTQDFGITLTMSGGATGTATTDPDTGNITISTTVPPPATTPVTVLDGDGNPITVNVIA